MPKLQLWIRCGMHTLTLISASGADVGLPDGQMGNSEVGHLTIGSGRIIQQELVRISNVVKNNQLCVVTELKRWLIH